MLSCYFIFFLNENLKDAYNTSLLEFNDYYVPKTFNFVFENFSKSFG